MHFRSASAPAAFCVLLASIGCNQITTPQALTPSAAPISVAGNWQISSSDRAASQLSTLSGALAGAGANITGVLHAAVLGACIAPGTAIFVSGSADSANRITLTGANLAGGTLKIAGTLAVDGGSIADASYTVTGGSCAFAAPVHAHVVSFSSISGSYIGNFSDVDGNVLSITATLTQTPASDPNGNFQLSGTGNLGTNPCFTSPATISNSQVTGGSFSLTYTDPNFANTVTAAGSFSTDGTTLTVTNWTLSGACGNDSGTGLLTRH